MGSFALFCCKIYSEEFVSAAEAELIAIAPTEKAVMVDNKPAMILVLMLLVFFMVLSPFLLFCFLWLYNNTEPKQIQSSKKPLFVYIWTLFRSSVCF